MNLTTSVIDLELKKAGSRKSTVSRKEINDKKNEELDEIRKKARSCPVKKVPLFRKNIGDTNYKEADKLSKNKFYDPTVAEAVSCSGQSYIFSMGTGRMEQNIRHYIKSLEQTGEPSAYGNVFKIKMKVDTLGVPSVGLVKTSRRENGIDDLLHELFIGLNVTNKLRINMGIPNFALVYGGFMCSGPILDPDTKKAVSWCDGKSKKVPYVLYENIENSISANDYTKKYVNTPEYCISMFLQILFAVDIAYDKYEFTHYDLHNVNVLMRPLPNKEFVLPYRNNKGKMVYLLSNAVATIIDYGMSGARYQNKYYGTHKIGAEKHFTFNNKGHPLFDIYKFLCFTLSTLIKINSEGITTHFFKRIFRFFNKTDNIEKAIKDQRKFYYVLPYNITKEYNMKGLIDYTYDVLRETNTRQIITSNEKIFYNYKTIRSTGNTFTFVEDLLNINNIPTPNTFYDYYDLKAIYGRYTKKWDNVKAYFDYDKSKDKYKINLNSMFGELQEVIESFIYLRVRSNVLFSKDVMEKLRHVFSLAHSAVFLFENLKKYLDIGLEVAKDYKDLKTINSIRESDLGDSKKSICKFLNFTVNIYNNTIAPSIFKRPKDRDNFWWYYDEANKIIILNERFCKK